MLLYTSSYVRIHSKFGTKREKAFITQHHHLNSDRAVEILRDQGNQLPVTIGTDQQISSLIDQIEEKKQFKVQFKASSCQICC